MKIVVTGGTGFVGKNLIKYLQQKGHDITILTRNPQVYPHSERLTYIEWLQPHSHPEEKLENIDVLINLAGESINSRWTRKRKEQIVSSRVQATNACYELIKKLKRKPKVFISASAIGYYGTSLQETFSEDDLNGDDFLAKTTTTWEHTANQVKEQGVRTVIARFGVILGKDEGALPRMLLPYKLFIGGTIGNGNQWISWVHIDDVIRALEFAINHNEIHGPINITAPTPKTMKGFGKEIGSVINKPHWLPLPAFILKIMLGEMAVMIAEGQRVIPRKLLDEGFRFYYDDLSEALRNLTKN